jgi:tetratricopeptide (TPR) repeat protein
MRQGQPARAIDLYAQSLAGAPELIKNHLSLAAAYLELGNPALACAHLAEYARAHPEDLLARVHYAELLFRLDRHLAAQRELERCVESTQELGELGDPSEPGEPNRGGGSVGPLLIHCHSRLMEIAESRGDAYAEHLNRGIGLLLLARESAATPTAETELPSEGLYCKAAGELTLALDERPGEARPSWYLHVVWSCLGQKPLAQRCLREAGEAAPFSYLTPVEQRALQLVNPAGAVRPLFNR